MENQTLFAYRDDRIYYHHTLTPRPVRNALDFLSHAHNQIEFYRFIRGSAQFAIEGSFVPLAPGTLVVIDRNVIHNLLILDENAPYERTAVLIDPSVIPGTFEPLSLIHGAGHMVYHADESARSWMEHGFALVESASNQDGVLPALIASLLTMLSAEMSHSIDRHVNRAANGDEIVLAIIRYINEHLTDDWSLDDLQNVLYRDKAYLNRHFRQIMGCPIWQYATRKRVFNAQQQLAFSRSIEYAYAHSGFSDYSTFYRNYKNYTGLSPSEDLRRRLKSGPSGGQ